jgi:hypothetical protein
MNTTLTLTMASEIVATGGVDDVETNGRHSLEASGTPPEGPR